MEGCNYVFDDYIVGFGGSYFLEDGSIGNDEVFHPFLVSGLDVVVSVVAFAGDGEEKGLVGEGDVSGVCEEVFDGMSIWLGGGGDEFRLKDLSN